MIDVPADRFDQLVADALDGIPEQLGRLMDNVVVVVEEGSSKARLLGRYEGIPLTARDNWYGSGRFDMPDRITIFRRAICAICATDAEVVEQVRITVVHEVAHHFGLDDARLHALGWG